MWYIIWFVGIGRIYTTSFSEICTSVDAGAAGGANGGGNGGGCGEGGAGGGDGGGGE